MAEIAVSNKRLYRGYLLKEQLRLILHMDDADEARKNWTGSSGATHSRIDEFKELVTRSAGMKEHILNTIRLKMSNARIESNNNKIKLIIRRAFGFEMWRV